jgi:hypothetical protein
MKPPLALARLILGEGGAERQGVGRASARGSMNKPSTLADGARRRAAEAVVREAADIWAQGLDTLEPSDALAVFVRVLAADVSFEPPAPGQGSTTIWNAKPYGDLPTKPLSEWRTEVGQLDQELARLAPGVPQYVREGCRSQLLLACRTAVREWESGNPEQPSTVDVARKLAQILFDSGCYGSWDWRSVRP